MFNISSFYSRSIQATFGLFLKRQRSIACISRPSLALALGLEESFIAKVENDKKKMPVEKFELLANVLKVSVDKIMVEYYSDILTAIILESDCSHAVLDITKKKLKIIK